WSNEVSVVTRLEPPRPPTLLRAYWAGYGAVGVEWTDNSNNETAFAVWRKVGNGEYTRIAVTIPNLTLFFDYDVMPGMTYTHQAAAITNVGASDWTKLASVATPAGPW